MKNKHINVKWLLAPQLGALHKQKSALDAAIERDTEKYRTAEAAGNPVDAEYFKGRLVAEIEAARWLERVIYDE